MADKPPVLIYSRLHAHGDPLFETDNKVDKVDKGDKVEDDGLLEEKDKVDEEDDEVDEMLSGSDYGDPVRPYYMARTLLSPRSVHQIVTEMQVDSGRPAWLRIIGKCVVVMILALNIWLSVDIIKQYIEDANNGSSGGDRVNHILMTVYWGSGMLTMSISAILLMFKRWTPTSIHRIIGYVYVMATCICGWFGIMYCLLNNTDETNIWMRIAFSVYWLAVMIVGAFVFLTGSFLYLNNQVISITYTFKFGPHSDWVLRSYILSACSFWYRALYIVSYWLGYKLPVAPSDFQRPIDVAFQWLFFAIPILIMETILYITRRYKLR
jgi:hypothetical protein